MLGGIAGQGVFNPSKMTRGLTKTVMSGTTNVDVINISGSGIVTCFYIHDIYTSCRATITIDGTIIYNDIVVSANSGMVISNMLPFNTSLRIQVREDSAQSVFAVATYLLY